MLIRKVRHDKPEKAGFGLNYSGHNYYSFFHFPIPFDVVVNGELFHTRPNACIFVPPMAHRCFRCNRSSTHNFLFINQTERSFLERYDIPENQLLYPTDASFISDIFREMELEYHSDNPYKEQLLNSYLEEFLIKLSRSVHDCSDLTDISIADRMKLRDLRYRILSQPEKKWTVVQMAEMMSLSPSRFHAVYKQVFLRPPMSDVAVAKIAYAKELLRDETHYTLQDITEMLGYQSQCHFINKFKAIAGVTPGEYRRAHR